MEEIEHQFSNKDFYIPNWNIKHLFIGTFNPQGGEEVKYYYGRSKNRTWELLSQIFKENLDPNNVNFFNRIEERCIACMDLIHAVNAPNNKITHIIGKGYADSKIINNTVQRQYNIENIENVIIQNPGVKIYSTWGKGSELKNWRREVIKIENLINLVSPSMVARVPSGNEKFAYMLNNWAENIIP